MRLRIRLRFEVITEAVDVETELLCVADQIVRGQRIFGAQGEDRARRRSYVAQKAPPCAAAASDASAASAVAGSCRRFERLETLQVDAANPVDLDDDHHHGGAVSAPGDCSRPA